MQALDRLSALMSKFELRVEACGISQANFAILDPYGDRSDLKLRFSAATDLKELPGSGLFSARVNWGRDKNPMLGALPPVIDVDLAKETRLLSLVDLLIEESDAARCGSASVLNRLGEILVVNLVRRQIERGETRSGLLGGLADPRLSRAIVAIHERPEHKWRIDTLADEAGLSKSRFTELFRVKVGETPLAYLRRWRMILARQDIERGEQIQRVANRYCYGSSEAFSRSFHQAYGISPMQARCVQASA